MRKILIILALLALSIQTSYATVAVYCQEELEAASHVSHHDHEKLVSIASAGDSKSNDSDCGLCHLAHFPALHSTFSISVTSTIFHYEDARLEFLFDISPRRPEKPNWLALT